MHENKQKYNTFRAILIMDGQIFEGVWNFRYLGTLINLKNVISDEIISSIAVGNRYFYNLRRTFRSRTRSKALN